MGYGHHGLWSIVKVIYFVLASFVFSFIFWATKVWIDRQCAKPQKKKK